MPQCAMPGALTPLKGYGGTTWLTPTPIVPDPVGDDARVQANMAMSPYAKKRKRPAWSMGLNVGPVRPTQPMMET
jgi:hypothetical protein